MANLFPIFQRANKETIAKLTATLQAVTRGNIVKHDAHRFANFVVDVTNFTASAFKHIRIDRPTNPFSQALNLTTGLISKIKIPMPEVVQHDERVQENYSRLISFDRADLDRKFRAELKERVENSIMLSNDAALSHAMINAAYSGKDSLRMWQKADAVAQKSKNDFPKQDSAFFNLFRADFLDLHSINRKCLALCVRVARDLYGRPFAPTEEELAAWTGYQNAFSRANANWEAYYRKMLPTKAEFLPDAEIERRVEDLRAEHVRLTDFVRQALDDEFRSRKKFSERAEVERDDFLERMPTFFVEEWYRSEVAENNQRFQQKMEQRKEPIYIAENSAVPRAIAAPRADEPLETEEVLPRLREAINSANKEIDIMVPWMIWQHVENNFLRHFRAAIARKVTIKIRYGYHYGSERYSETNAKSDFAAGELLKALGKDCLKIFCDSASYGGHGKLVIFDDDCYIDGSYNFMSYGGRSNDELTTVHYDKNILSDRRAKYFSF